MSFGPAIVGRAAEWFVNDRQRLLILIYHRVRSATDPLFPLEVDAQQFELQMRLLRTHCNPLPLTEAVHLLREQALPKRAVAVTFDDGYADNHDIALPILKNLSVPATFFIASHYLDGGRMWNDTIIEAIRACEHSVLDLGKLGLGQLSIQGAAEKSAAISVVLTHAKHKPQGERERLANAIADLVGAELPCDLMMTEAQVRVVGGAGMEIGGHTETHPILSAIADDQALVEIERNRNKLGAIAGVPIKGFAYPNGRPVADFGPRHVQMVRDLGFEYAVSTQRGVARPGCDRYLLPRFTPWDREGTFWLARLCLEYRNAPAAPFVTT
jgi:peptidoglycan/xylan/chitin deacetylase (PgdA/CDA1 family)